MSFTFKWPRFSEEFLRDARAMLEAALNKGNKPPVIADKIEVVELEMGSQPPELDVREIGELTLEQFRGIFRLSYAGDAHIVLRTKVQANPLNHKRRDIHVLSGSGGMLAAHQPLVVPMLLRLSRFILNGYVVLVLSKQKGITIVFKTDPLQNVDVTGTFDSIAVIQKYIQHEIEMQLREMFREDLPGIIHRLSQRWIAGKTRVETPYLSRHRIKTVSEPTIITSSPHTTTTDERILLKPPSAPSVAHTNSESFSSSAFDDGRSNSSGSNFKDSFDDGSFMSPDLDNHDALYGLHSNSPPRTASYSSFKKLFAPSRGLADLSEESSQPSAEWHETNTVDTISWDARSISSSSEDVAEFETLPAIGGGTITRPRIYYTQSNIMSHSASTSRGRSELGYETTASQAMNSTGPIDPTTNNARAAGVLAQRRKDFLDKFARPRLNPLGDKPVLGPDTYDYGPISPNTVDLQDDFPRDKLDHPTIRSRSFSTSTRRSDNINIGSPPKFVSITDNDGKSHIVLRPGMSNSISHLTTLSHSNHTMSPFTRSFEHFTVRSVPHKPPASNSTAGQPTKARRRRIYRLKAVDVPVVNEEENRTNSPPPPSEFEASDIEHYFQSPPSPSLRRRPSYQNL